jgi:predicted heme/steroid binding protein
MILKKHWPWLTGLIVAVATFAVWIPGLADTKLTIYALFPLFGLLAWSLMWTHYINGVLVMRYGLERSRLYKTVSEVIVFFCLWLHPGLLIYQLWMDNSTIIEYVGQRNAVFILGAFAAWLAFLSYDILVRFKNRPFWKKHWIWVSLTQALAMGIIYLHAIKFGRHIQVSWFKVYWAVLGLVLVPCMVYLLWIELPEENILKERGRSLMKNKKLLLAIGVIAALAVGVGAYAAMTEKEKTTQSPATSTSQSTSQATGSSATAITLAQVQANNGQNGNKCWVIVDTTVYQISGFAQWVDGVHTSSGGKARCGKDLTDVIGDSPHGRSVLRLLTVVGSTQN